MSRKLLVLLATSVLATCTASAAFADDAVAAGGDVVAPLGLCLGGALGREVTWPVGRS